MSTSTAPSVIRRLRWKFWRAPHVSSRTIISIEKEQYSPSLMLAYRLALVFGVTVEELCCLAENKRMEDAVYENL